MRILGIDYGRKKIGLALTEGALAEPWKVFRVKSFEEALEKVSKEVKVSKVSKVVVGMSENKMAEETKKFVSAISHRLSTPVETFDETLSTIEAQRLSIEAGIKRKKRHGLEDAYAAAVMLQSYLEEHV